MNPSENKHSVLHLEVGNSAEIQLLAGDVTEIPADAIVNAANSELEPGGGVCGAIHRKGGPVIAEECRKIVRQRGPIPPGQAAATTAGNLPAKYVIHAVGPIWRGGSAGEPETLAGAYRSSVQIAEELKLHSVAFPAISTGIYGYPLEEAAKIAVAALTQALQRTEHVRLASIVLFNQSALDTFARVAGARQKVPR